MATFKVRLLRFLIGLNARRLKKQSHLEIRAGFERVGSTFARPIPGLTVQKIALPNCGAEWLAVGDAPKKTAILYLHGGGFVYGSSSTHRNSVSHFAHFANAKALVVDYRRAPENRFPCALNDARDGYQWLCHQGIEPRHIVFAGDSAGGGLALSLLMQLRDEGQRMPAAAVLISPWVDLTMSGSSVTSNCRTDPMVTKTYLEEWAQMYAGPHQDLRDPYISPLFGRFIGLPPLMFVPPQASCFIRTQNRP